MMAVIYHGTPLTPRAALMDVCAGRAMCVSFYRPDDVEVVEAISPAIMFRQWRVQLLATVIASRTGMGSGSRLGAILSLAGTPSVSSRPVGRHSRHARRAIPAQRCTAQRLAFRAEGRAALAHGRPDRALGQAMRPLRAGLSWLGRRDEGRSGCGLRRLPQAHGRGFQTVRQSMAGHSHDARNSGGAGLSIRQRRQHEPCAERMAVRFTDGRTSRRQVAGTAGLCRQIGGQAR